MYQYVLGVTILVGLQVKTAGTPKLNAGEIGEGKVAGNGINWTTPSNINGTQVVDCAPASEPNDRSIETLQATLSTKNIALTQTALGVLFHKRAKLVPLDCCNL